MNRRGFLSTLLLPLLPTPQLPMEQGFRVAHIPLKVSRIFIDTPSRRLEMKFKVGEQVVFASVNIKGMKKLQLETK